MRTPSTWPAFVTSTAGARSSSMNASIDRGVPLHRRDRRRHHLGHVGLEGVGVAEHALEQLAVADRTDELRDVRGVLADHRRLRDAVLVQEVDGGADLVVGPDGDAAAAARRPWREHPVDRHDLGALEEAVLAHPRVGVDLRQVLPAGVGQQHDDDRVRVVDPAGDLERGVDGGAAGAADQDALAPRHRARGEERVAVGDPDPVVDDRRGRRCRARSPRRSPRPGTGRGSSPV